MRSGIAAWSAVHGLTILVIDRIPKAVLSLDEMIDRLMRTVTAGLRKPGGEPSSEVHGARCNGKRQEAPSILESPGRLAGAFR